MFKRLIISCAIIVALAILCIFQVVQNAPDFKLIVISLLSLIVTVGNLLMDVSVNFRDESQLRFKQLEKELGETKFELNKIKDYIQKGSGI